MWMIILNAGKYLIKNPVYIAVFVLGIMCTGLWVNNKMQDNTIAKQAVQIEKLEAFADRVENNLEVCETNEDVLQRALDEANTQTQAAHDKSAVLGEQVRSEQARVAEWMKKYQDKVCLNNNDEVPIPKDRIIYATPIEYLPTGDTENTEELPKAVVPTKNKVVTNEKSDEVIDSINGLFDTE